ncbi:MAG: hypothetical protein KAJ25_08005, partial [Desulfobacula sp.]|nr:hypothetical protein [Desulfobacula sp.]
MTTEETEEKTEEVEDAVEETEQKPLWLAIEEKLLGLNTIDLSGEAKEEAIQKIIKDLDNEGFNFFKKSGNIMHLRWAMDDMMKVGRPLMKDFNDAIAALSLEDVLDAYSAATDFIDKLGETWEEIRKVENRPDIIRIIEETKLDLLVKKAKEMSENEAIRYLIGKKVSREDIISKLAITEEKLAEVEAEIAKEKAERARVADLLGKVEDKSDLEKIKHLITNEVAEELIIEMAGVDKVAIEKVQKVMEEELKEQQRKAEEEAVNKKAEAAGPALEDITPEDMLDY